MNEITLKGKVVSINKDFISKLHVVQVMLEVKRTSGTIDKLPVHLPIKLGSFIELNSYIKVVGMIRTANIYDEEKKITHVCVYVYAKDLETITEEESLVENNIFLCEGVICKKFDKRVTSLSERTVMNATLAVNREKSCYKNKIDYIPILLWSVDVVYIDKLNLFTKVDLTGRLQSRKYFSKKRQETGIAYEVSVASIYALDEDTEEKEND